MKSITYTFIIPHKNSPVLLQRCVNSIPDREDVQVIVVDDNSAEGRKPDGLRHGVEIISLGPEESNGAGHARNVGLSKAKGQWILFVDADDWYSEDFITIIEKYKNTDNEVVFFNFNIENGDKLKGSELSRWKYVQQRITSKDPQYLKFCFHVPWDKMISKAFIEQHNITFEEVVLGNDIQFSLLVGYYARQYQIIDNHIYNYFINGQSLSFGFRSVEKLMCVIEGWYKVNAFYNYIGLKGKNKNIPLQFAKMLFHNRKRALVILVQFIEKQSHFSKVKKKYVKRISVDGQA